VTSTPAEAGGSPAVYHSAKGSTAIVGVVIAYLTLDETDRGPTSNKLLGVGRSFPAPDRQLRTNAGNVDEAAHLNAAESFARRITTLRGRTPCELTAKYERRARSSISNPHQQTSRPNSWIEKLAKHWPRESMIARGCGSCRVLPHHLDNNHFRAVLLR